MRAVVQRVTRASVRVENEIVGEISGGALVLLGVGRDDTKGDAIYLVEKIVGLRIFDDTTGRMNLSLEDIANDGRAKKDGGLLIVSQFTLYGDVRRGKRPSWSDAAPPEAAEMLYRFFVSEARKKIERVATGTFQAMMEVELINDGPVTILLDSRKLF
ncbi:MAG: D-aminoacyl-tRNA deacylase [Pyrinomonadaceae bacterium]